MRLVLCVCLLSVCCTGAVVQAKTQKHVLAPKHAAKAHTHTNKDSLTSLEQNDAKCLKQFEHDISASRCQTHVGAVDTFASQLSSEMSLLAGGFKHRKAHFAFLEEDAATSKLVASITQRAKLATARDCRVQNSPCTSTTSAPTSLHTIPAEFGESPDCPYLLATGEMEHVKHSDKQRMISKPQLARLHSRWMQIADSFSDVKESELVGDSRLIASAAVVCSELATVGLDSRYETDKQRSKEAAIVRDVLLGRYSQSLHKAAQEEKSSGHVTAHFHRVLEQVAKSQQGDHVLALEEDETEIKDIVGLDQEVLDELINRAHNSDFVAQGAWQGWWFCATENFRKELSDHAQGGAGGVLQFDKAYGEAKGYDANHLTETQQKDWWWHFEFGIAAYPWEGVSWYDISTAVAKIFGMSFEIGSQTVAPHNLLSTVQIQKLADYNENGVTFFGKLADFGKKEDPTVTDTERLKAKRAFVLNEMKQLLGDSTLTDNSMVNIPLLVNALAKKQKLQMLVTNEFMAAHLNLPAPRGRRHMAAMFRFSGETALGFPNQPWMPWFEDMRMVDAAMYTRGEQCDRAAKASGEYATTHCYDQLSTVMLSQMCQRDSTGRAAPLRVNGVELYQTFPRAYDKVLRVVSSVLPTPCTENCGVAQGAYPRLQQFIDAVATGLDIKVGGTPRPFLQLHHDFQYHDLYHALTFSHAIGQQLAAHSNPVVRSLEEAGRIGGLAHDFGYVLLKHGIPGHTQAITNAHNEGVFGNFHEMLSMNMAMRLVHKLTGPSFQMTVPEKAAIGYVIWATKIDLGNHLTRDEFDRTLLAFVANNNFMEAESRDLFLHKWVDKISDNTKRDYFKAIVKETFQLMLTR